MFGLISYEEIYGHEDEYIFIDVRSQKEAFEEPMIGSVNIPVLLNEERDVVGTLYVRESAEAAKEQGIEFISRRLPEIFKQVQELYRNKHGKKLVIFCARGGMRSGSLHSLLNSLGINCYKLEGGYKAYRSFIINKIEEFSKEIDFISNLIEIVSATALLRASRKRSEFNMGSVNTQVTEEKKRRNVKN